LLDANAQRLNKDDRRRADLRAAIDGKESQENKAQRRFLPRTFNEFLEPSHKTSPL
jgi:hypothetical protein